MVIAKMSTMKIAVSGSAGVGKTTLAQNLAQALNIAYIPEHYEPLFDSLDKLDSPPNGLAELFNKVLDIKLSEQEKYGSFVADRCSADLLNLWLRRKLFGLPEASQAFHSRCREAMSSYDLIVIPPWGRLPLVATEQPDRIQQRVVNPWLQLLNHASIAGFVRMFVDEEKIIYLPSELPLGDSWVNMVLARMGADGRNVQ